MITYICVNCGKNFGEITKTDSQNSNIAICSFECSEQFNKYIIDKISTSRCKDKCLCRNRYNLYGVKEGRNTPKRINLNNLPYLSLYERVLSYTCSSSYSHVKNFSCKYSAMALAELFTKNYILKDYAIIFSLNVECESYDKKELEKGFIHYALSENNKKINNLGSEIKIINQNVNEIKDLISDFMKLLANTG